MISLITNFLEPLSYIIYTIVFLTYCRKGMDKRKLVLFCYYLFASGFIFYACILAHVQTWGDNNWMYNFFFLVTICVLSYYFYQTINNGWKRKIILFVFLLNIVLFVWHDIVLKQFHLSYNNYVVALCFLSIITFSLLYFHQLINHVTQQSILLNRDFWLVSGYLLYFLGAFFVVLFYKHAAIHQRAILWGLQNIILFLAATITLCGNLWIGFKKTIA